MKNAIITALVLVIVIGGGYFLLRDGGGGELNQETSPPAGEDQTTQDAEGQTVIGTSVDGRDIVAHHFGDGEVEVLLVGGIHGGYSWNTALLGHEAVDYFETNSERIPENVRVTVIPVLNPDGLFAVTGEEGRFSRADVSSSQQIRIDGRFNANGVDLNRNFACDWQQSGVWQSRTVSGGSSAFSEPEARAIRDYVGSSRPEAVIVYYSAAGGVFASNCHDGILPETLEITNVYADAAGYQAFEQYDFYEITGDMVNWLASEGIPAISILLTDREDVEWSRNRAGIEAILEYYGNNAN